MDRLIYISFLVVITGISVTGQQPDGNPTFPTEFDIEYIFNILSPLQGNENACVTESTKDLANTFGISTSRVTAVTCTQTGNNTIKVTARITAGQKPTVQDLENFKVRSDFTTVRFNGWQNQMSEINRGSFKYTIGLPGQSNEGGNNIQFLTVVPLLVVGALQQVKIREIPGIPIVLDILQDIIIEFMPCAASCLMHSKVLMEIYDDIMYMNGTYATCVMGTVSQINLTSSDEALNFLTDKSRLCPAIDDAYECMANELERSCGSGLRAMFDRIYQKTDIFDCSQKTEPLNIYTCGVDPIIRPLINGNNSMFESISTCVNASVHQQRLAPAGSWSVVYGEEESTGFPTLCGFVRDVVDCAVNALRSYREDSVDCGQFERTVYENLNSVLEVENCFNNGTATLRCLADPDLLEPMTGSGQANQRRKRQAPPILVHCFDIWTDGDLDSRIQTALPNLQTDLEAGNLQAIAEAVAKETCGDLSRFVKCIVDNAFPAKLYCNFIGRGLSTVAAPMLQAYNTLGDCEQLPLDNDQQDAVRNCSCLADFPSGPLGTCERSTGDTIQDIVFTLVIRQPWNDSLADKPCSEVGSLNIICQELELILGNNLNIAVKFLGIAPNVDDEIELFYEAEIPMSQLKTVESSLETLVRPERVQTIRVSTDVNVKQIVNRDLIINKIQPRKGAMAGGTPVTITGYFLENIALITIGNIDCQLKIRSPVVYICITGPLLDSTLVDKPLAVKSAAHDFGKPFMYVPDPIITSVQPLKSIITGGASLTVSGAYFDNVVISTMMTTVTSLVTRKSYMTPTKCSIRSSTQLICPTAPIVLNRLVKKRKRRQAPVTVNAQENIEVRIAFVLDGVEEYRNLTGTSLEEYSSLDIYADPVIEAFQPSILTFTSSWPVEQKFIEIQGKDLLVGLQKQEYVVRIGEAMCGNIIVQNNLIVCEPPKTRPKVAAEDDVGYNKIPVKLIFASQVGDLGHLSYIQNLWEYPPGRYGIIGALCGVVVIIILIVVCCLCKRRQFTHDSGRPGDYPSAQQQFNLTQKVKRWSRKSPKRFSSFIPSGNRAQTNYPPSSYDGGYTHKQQPYWDNY